MRRRYLRMGDNVPHPALLCGSAPEFNDALSPPKRPGAVNRQRHCLSGWLDRF